MLETGPRFPAPMRIVLVTVAVVALATVSTQAIYWYTAPSIGLLFYPAIIFASVYGGYGAAGLATVLSTLAAAYFFTPPRYSFNFGIDDGIRVTAFALVSFATAWLAIARRRAEKAQRELISELREAIGIMRSVSLWPAVVGPEAPASTRRMLAHAAKVVGARSVLVAWESDEEPWLYMSSSHSADAATRYAPTDVRPLVSERLDNEIFLSVDVRGATPVSVYDHGILTEWQGTPLHPDLLDRLPAGSLVSAPFRAEHLSGRVFFTGIEGPTAKTIPAVEVVTREIGNSVDQLYLAEQAQDLMLREERLRVARDLHDGVLQALTGIRLELQALAERTSFQKGVTDVLRTVAGALAIEQRELRRFIDSLKPASAAEAPSDSLAARLEQMCGRLSAEWQTPVSLRMASTSVALPVPVEQTLSLAIHEGIVNALKHGHPSRVAVDVDVRSTGLRVEISDDGRGFSYRGRFEHEELLERNLGPVSLRERVAAHRGRLTLESTATGSRVEFFLPADDQADARQAIRARDL